MSALVGPAALAERLPPLLERGRREAARQGGPVLVSLTTRVHPMDPLQLFEAAEARKRVLWEQPSREFSMVGVGVAARLTRLGPGRFPQVTAAWRRLLAGALTDAEDGTPFAPPIALGGFAFDPGARPDRCWEGYDDALLVVPRFLFLSGSGSAWLTVSLMAAPDCDAQALSDAAAAELGGLLSRAGALAGEGRFPGDLALEEEVEAGRWMETVAAILQDIRRGAVEKLVLARRLHVRSQAPLSPGPALGRLRAGYRDCTVFAFALEGGCFLGATPELLVRLQGRRVQAHGLAGSAARGGSEEQDRALGEALLADGKERHEHALVVRALQLALEPLCNPLSVPERPVLLRMPNVQHLYTPIEGSLKDHRHILELVERLHPTPASSGLPGEAALGLIRSYEAFGRGWYAGPVGWVDGHGGGEFAVAIRSALVRGSEALLYAGCGIVAGSDPQREYRESCLKLKPMLWALNSKGT